METAFDAVIARRVIEVPQIPSVGKRFDPNASPVVAKLEEKAAEPASQDVVKSVVAGSTESGKKMIQAWHEAASTSAEKEIVQQLEGCMMSSPALSDDPRAIELAGASCKLQIQLLAEQKAKAAQKLLGP